MHPELPNQNCSPVSPDHPQSLHTDHQDLLVNNTKVDQKKVLKHLIHFLTMYNNITYYVSVRTAIIRLHAAALVFYRKFKLN